ncbi:MAG: hypothetical protein HY707_13775 [Ignavibacteriae bacterium]|nr:hypothetical protein [Ignavibacteriota bacterium]
MESRRHNRILTVIVLPVWVVYLVLIWVYRFIPSVDYPEWLFQANILLHYIDPESSFSQWYDLIPAPVPNAGFVLPTALLSVFIPIETSGKIILSLYIIWFPLAVRSFYNSIGQHPWYWVIGILLLFNISFFNGNLSFLIGLCLLFSALARWERRKGRFKFRDYFTAVVIAFMIFLSHAVCALVYLLYCLVRVFEKGSKPTEKRVVAVSAIEILTLTALYLVTKPKDSMITVVNWLPDLQYRVFLLTKPFFIGWAYPPFEFSLFRFLITSFFVVVGLTMTACAFRSVKEKFPQSAIAKLTVAVTLLMFLGPKHIFGIAELSHRFALIWFPLMIGFTRIPLRLNSVVIWTLIALTYVTTVVRLKDYHDSSLIISKRHEFLQQHIEPGYPLLTLDDDLGERKAQFHHLVPKGVSFTFQADYFMMNGGYNPFSFPTAFLVPRDTFIFLFYNLTTKGGLDGVLGLRGTDIHDQIRYIIIDTASDWGTRLANGLAPHFRIISEAEVTKGVRTIILERASLNA